MNNNESNSNEGYEWPIVVRNSSRHSNLDYYYGPYNSYEDMEANVPSTVRDFGFTAAVHNADGSVTEYWLVGTSKSNLKWQQKYVQFNEAISVKGSVSSLEELEAKTDNKVGDMYLIKNDDGTYSEYIWVVDEKGNGHWELLGTESTLMKGALKFKGVTATTDDGTTCSQYNGSQNVTVDMNSFATTSALSTAATTLHSMVVSEIAKTKKSISCRNYALKTYKPKTFTTTTLNPVDSNGNYFYDAEGKIVKWTENYYKALAGNPACEKGTKITVSFDYDIKITEGSFNILVQRVWNLLMTVSASTSGHFSKTITLSETITNCEKNSVVYIQGSFIGSCKISNFKWELGDTETEWCPAPEDLVTHINDNTMHVTDASKVVMKNDDGSVTFSQNAYFRKNNITGLINPLIYRYSYNYTFNINKTWNPYGITAKLTYNSDAVPINTSGTRFIARNHYLLTVEINSNTLPVNITNDIVPIVNCHTYDGKYLTQAYASVLYVEKSLVAPYNKYNIYIRTADDATQNDIEEIDILLFYLCKTIE